MSSSRIVKKFREGIYDHKEKYTPLDLTQFLLVHLKLYETWIHGRRAIRSEDTEIQLLPIQAPNTSPKDVKSEDWRELWSQLHHAVRYYWEKKGWNEGLSDRPWFNHSIPNLTPKEVFACDREIAEECLSRMESIDEAIRASGDAALSSKYTGQDSVFPDELVTAVGLFILPKRVAGFPRLHRLIADAEATSTRFKEVESANEDESAKEGNRNEEGKDDEDDDFGEEETIKDVGSRPPSRSAEETAPVADASNLHVLHRSVAPSNNQDDPGEDVGEIWETWGGA